MKKILCTLLTAIIMVVMICPVMATNVNVGNSDATNLFTKLETMMPSDPMDRILVWRTFKAYMLDGTNGIDTIIKAVKGQITLPDSDAGFKDFIDEMQNESQVTRDGFIFILNMYKAVPLEKRRASLNRFGQDYGDTIHTEIVMDKLVFESAEQEACAREIYNRYVPASIQNEFKEHFYVDGVNYALDVDNFLVLLTAFNGEFRMTDSGNGDFAIESYSENFLQNLALYNNHTQVNGVSISDESLLVEGYDILDGIVEFFNTFTEDIDNLKIVLPHNEINLYMPGRTIAQRPGGGSTGGITGGGGNGGMSGTTQYTINYETNGGNAIASENKAKGSTVELIKVPVREGYAFEGWYADAAFENRIEEVVMTGNITVYANWVKDNGNAGHGNKTPAQLNGDDHIAYVMGYPDGTVKPNNNISRAEVTSIFFRILKEDVREANLTESNNFNDVESAAWFNTAISTMAALGIVNGRDTGGFDPDAFITRAEFAVICARFDNSAYEAAGSFSDISGHWAEAEIVEAAARGWIRGYEDGTFKPEQYITRAEAMTMINRVLNRIPETAEDLFEGMSVWPDNSDSNVWYYLPVQEATNSHEYMKKNSIYEKWTKIGIGTDWTKYE